MTQFQLFDSVNLKEGIALEEGDTAPEGTPGAIVEVFKDGEAFMVELFGGWVKTDEEGGFVSADPEETGAFLETLGIETVYPHQLTLVKPAREVMGVKAHLNVVLEQLSEDLLAEVSDFAEFLRQKQQQKRVASS
jgi:Protein of unknown function (DUF2281)